MNNKPIQETPTGFNPMRLFRIGTRFMRIVLLMVSVTAVSVTGAIETSTVLENYPNLASGVLTYAKLRDLPEEQILLCGSLVLNASNMEHELKNIPEPVRDEMRNNLFFLLEQKSTRDILQQYIFGESVQESAPSSEKDKRIRDHVVDAVGTIEITDAEMTTFFEENKDMFGGASLDQIKEDLRNYMASQKQQEAVEEYIRTMGQRIDIVLSASWVESQAALSKNNAVDRARSSGIPSLVDFGSTGCRPCDMMAPILETLKTKYAGKMNVEFIHVREQQVLAARYGIQSIPIQILFDQTGKEVWRHTGFIPQSEIETKIATLGME